MYKYYTMFYALSMSLDTESRAVRRRFFAGDEEASAPPFSCPFVRVSNVGGGPVIPENRASSSRLILSSCAVNRLFLAPNILCNGNRYTSIHR